MAFFSSRKPIKFICIYCGIEIPERVNNYAIEHFGAPFCLKHQDKLKIGLTKSTPSAKKLFFALLENEIKAEIEKFDGFKHIDIAIPTAMVNIEIDGGHHNYDARQALSDLQRTLHSFKKGYLTLRIPNSLIENNLQQTVKYIVQFIDESYDQLDDY